MAGTRPSAQEKGTSSSIPETFDRRHASHARPYTIWDAPRAVKQVFSKFPLHTAASEPRPAHLSRLEKVQGGKKIQLWSNTLSEDPKVPSYNVNCLKYQALLLADGVEFDVVRTVSDGSPDGRLPFLLTTNANKQLNLVRSEDVETFVLRQRSEERASEEEQEQLRNREAEGVGILEKDVRAAWLYSCYLTPENFRNVVFKLYVASVTHARLSHYAMLDRIYADAREEFSKLEYTPDLGYNSWRGGVPAEHLDIARSLNRRAGKALDHLVELLDGRTFFSGTSVPGALDTALFAYTHLITQSEFANGISWADTRLAEEFTTRTALVRHEQAVYEFCFEGRRDVPAFETKTSNASFTDAQAQSMYQESQTSFSEINESAYQDSQHSYEELGESSYQPESQESYAEIDSSDALQSQDASTVEFTDVPELEPASYPDAQAESALAEKTALEEDPGRAEQVLLTSEEDAAAMSSSHLFA